MSASSMIPYGMIDGGRSPTPGCETQSIDSSQIGNMIMINITKHMWWGNSMKHLIHSCHPSNLLDNNDNNNIFCLIYTVHSYICISYYMLRYNCIGILTLPNLLRLHARQVRKFQFQTNDQINGLSQLICIINIVHLIIESILGQKRLN